MDELNKKEFMSPSDFFRKVNHDKATAIKCNILKIKITDKNNITTEITDPNEVKQFILDFWRNLYSSKQQQNTTATTPWLHTTRMQEIKNIINKNDNALTEPITEDELTNTVKNMQEGKATGDDYIPTELIQAIIDNENVQKYLTKAYNHILTTNTFPKKWKKGLLFTIFKNRCSFSPKNYRPITLLNSSYKIFSSIITNRLVNFIEDTGIISHSQGGFRRNKPTWNKIWALRNVIEHARINKNPLHITYIDLAKAYDSVEY